jgi:hypothetical protein
MVFFLRPALQQHPTMIVDDADRHRSVKVAEAMGWQFVGAANLPVIHVDEDHLFKRVVHVRSLQSLRGSS